MRLKKKIAISLIAVSLFSLGFEASVQNDANAVQAARRLNKKRLTRNAIVYTAKGHKKHTLKRGHVVKILGTKTIKGVKYYRIGKDQYVKVANFAKVVKRKAKHTKRVKKVRKVRRTNKKIKKVGKQVAKPKKVKKAKKAKKVVDPILDKYQKEVDKAYDDEGYLEAIRDTYCMEYSHSGSVIDKSDIKVGEKLYGSDVENDTEKESGYVYKENGQYILEVDGEFATTKYQMADFKFVPQKDNEEDDD